ncbi:glycosyl hydrolase 115 family protein [Pontiella sulfatireligans]|uniref:Gylcosyl hydrolase 115 C-terminal domain-containing protein n=1 Tax=Pontiella sulfatireligans TaxID=2750658 RepID=A0A6C2UEL5_9BACT|nr:glycosyl hydrolase 115 family protein [Pontiella sulfatireligans]VGO18620.1 hypothetical protein SCARR_00673 [Pontiella sulfatireligans]
MKNVLVLSFLLVVMSAWCDSSFTILKNGNVAPICVDADAAPVLHEAARMLAEDIEAIGGVRPAIVHAVSAKPAIYLGQVGKSALIQQLAGRETLPVKQLTGGWERFLHARVNGSVVVMGSDPRGTAYGTLELSRMLGISPWIWWADLPPEPRTEIELSVSDKVFAGPAVQYRGIFINDEDNHLRPWACNYFNEEHLGPKAYEKIYELMLRLRANYLWPAMHNRTNSRIWGQLPHKTFPFHYVEGNREMANRFGIIIGSSHHEPLHRNTLHEWGDENGREKYGYYANKELFLEWLKKRVVEAKECDNIFTLAMRGSGDSGIKVPDGVDVIDVINEGILAQRQILADVFKKPAQEIPQIFVPYSEVLKQFNEGLIIPEDVTLVWPDNNSGTMRQYPDADQQARSGGNGVYYHFQHLGPGISGRTTWLNSTPLDLIAKEHHAALQAKTDKLWVVNVGDIKHAEKELEFYMDLAWDPAPWTEETAMSYYQAWAARTFEADSAAEIASIQSDFIDLIRFCRAEYIDADKYQFERDEEIQRTEKWQELISRTDAVSARLPARLQDAYFHLIAYPVKACAGLHSSRYLAKRSRELSEQGSPEANELARKAYAQFMVAQQMADYFNNDLQNGKWYKMTAIANYIPFRPPVVGWRYEIEPKLPKLSLSTARIEAPMQLVDGALSGPTEQPRYAPGEGGSASWTFTSNVEGFIALDLFVDCPSVLNDSLYVTLNGQRTTVEWLLNAVEPGMRDSKALNRQKGPLWQTVLLLDLKKGRNTLTLATCEPVRILDLKLSRLSNPD